MRESHRNVGAALALFSMLAVPAFGVPQQWVIRIDDAGDFAPSLSTDANSLTETDQVLDVQCPNEETCDSVQVAISGPDGVRDLEDQGSGTERTFNFTLDQVPASGGTLDFEYSFAGNSIRARFPISQAGGQVFDAAPSSDVGSISGIRTGGETVAELLKTVCLDWPGAGNYDASNNLAYIVVGPTGQVLSIDPTAQFDEDDTLLVTVVADVRLLPLLRVTRKSAFRDAGTFRILGQGTDLSGIDLQAAADRTTRGACATNDYLLQNFAPGKGEVEIRATGVNDGIGSFDFQVNPLYSGILTLGPVVSDLVDPDFTLSDVGSDRIITAGNQGDEDVIYALFYTPFLWGKRDLEKRPPLFSHRRLNPSIGAAFEDLTDNVFVGISYDLPLGFVVTWGYHFRRVTALPNDLGLVPGEPFDAPMGDNPTLPTSKEWKDEAFWGLTIDLRAAVTFFQAAAGGGGS